MICLFLNMVNNYFLLFLRGRDLDRMSGMVDEKSMGLVRRCSVLLLVTVLLGIPKVLRIYDRLSCILR